MISDPIIRDQAYQYFLEEAPDLLETIEHELFNLNNSDRVSQTNQIMRATHTLKGGAANVGLKTIETVAHSLEDILKALYNPDLKLDEKNEKLLWDSYDCLRLLLSAELTGATVDHEEILDHAQQVFAQLQNQFQDYLTAYETFPGSEAIGLDIVQSFFEEVVPEKLQEIADAIHNLENNELVQLVHSQAEIFLGLGESLNLPGFRAISQTTLKALETNPEQITLIAQTALTDWQQAKQEILAGERESVGKVSRQLLQLSGVKIESKESLDTHQEPLEKTIKQFSQFLATDFANFDYKKNIDLTTKQYYFQIIKCLFGWFYHHQNIPLDQLSFELLIPAANTQKTYEDNSQEIFQELNTWLNQFNDFLDQQDNRPNIKLYRQWQIWKVSLLIAQFQYFSQVESPQQYQDISLIQKIRTQIVTTYQIYQQSGNLEPQPKQWVNQRYLQELIYSIDDLFEQNITKKSHKLQVIDHDKSMDIQVNKPAVTITDKTFIPDKKKTITETEIASKSVINNPTVRVKLESLETLNNLVGEVLINQNKNILQNEYTQDTVKKLLETINKNEQIIYKLTDWLDENLMNSETQDFLTPLPNQSSKNINNLQLLVNPTNYTVTNLKHISPISEFNSEQYYEIHRLLKRALKTSNEAAKLTENLKIINQQSNQNHKRQQRMLFNMRDEMIEARMSPVGNIFNRFPRLIKQLSNTYKKTINLKINGSHILIDKAIEEKLYEPLLHLVRNAFDHGIESPSLRSQLGKPETGEIEIRAYYQGSKTVVEVRDDGQGLNLESIKRRAINLNFISDQQAQHISDSELLELLFEPRFSTSEQINELSGRGVGLDVVRSQIQALKGTIEIESIPEKGTTFSLQIPLTLTIARLMVCQAGGIVYSLLLDAIEKIILPTANQIKIFEGQKVLQWETETEKYMVPVRELSSLIPYTRQAKQSEQLPQSKQKFITNPILLLRRNTGFLGLEVEQVLGEQELVIRPLGSAISPPNYVYGCSVLSNSRLTLVIDGIALMEQLQYQTPHQVNHNRYAYSTDKLALKPQSKKQTTQPQILVVDDSISLRQTVVLTLQKANYRVLQAGDGIEALTQLRQENISIVVCDLEMPRMNGFEFLKALRRDEQLAKIPVIILTSRQSEKYRRLALELGAVAYLNKPQEEQHFLASIADFIAQYSLIKQPVMLST